MKTLLLQSPRLHWIEVLLDKLFHISKQNRIWGGIKLSLKISLDNVSSQRGSAVLYAACLSPGRIKDEAALSFGKF